ncbi:Transposon Ty3-G Gag-Pol polyprotein [Labeo rohita]|uniref:ribonuclease H n=1 Tax=Labeo rohita TaxID=84645 RepID=A0ABQ8MJX9_LABRO|nr:Transposon Ty3-G Gag-Pol polyprotein [Labeo rohita]
MTGKSWAVRGEQDRQMGLETGIKLGSLNSSRVETLWERLQRDRALNHVCNQTNGRTKRHRRQRSVFVSVLFPFWLLVCTTFILEQMSKKSEKTKNVSKPGFRACVPPCSRYISSGDTHALCVACLGAEHAASALERSDCPHCDALPMRLLRSRKDLFSAEGSFISVPRGSGPASAEAERRLHSWGSQLDLVEGMETGDPLSSASPTRSAARPSGSEARAAVSSPRGSASTLAISSSEEVDVVSVDEAAAPQFPQYEELLEVVTRAVAKLSIDWPAEPLVEPQKSKLDERFLRSRPPPARRSLPFFPDLHTEVSRSWNAPFSSRLFIPASYNYGYVAGLDERGYRAMPRVEQTLASYLSPESASSLKAPVLPSKPLRVTSALVGKGYTAAGQAGACLHTMSVLQAYQADLLKELDEGEEIKDSDISELRRTADLSLRATKETARAIGRSMAALVAAERHLWLTLSDMKEKDRVFLLDAPLSPAGLFGDAVNAVVDRYQEARKQAAAFQRFLPRRHPARGAAATEQPQPSTSSSYREAQKQSVATRTPPHREQVVKRSRSRTSQAKPDLRVVLQSKRSSTKRPIWGETGSTAVFGVRVPPPCPREIALPTLPVFQGAAVSSEHPPQFFPPGNVAGLGSSPPPRGSLGPLVQVLPAGQPFQDTVPAAPLTPEASLERLVPLVDHLAAWKLLPNVSAWVLHTVERGYRIQFGAPPPPFNGVSPTLVGPEQGLVMEQEVATLLRKEAIEVVPPHERESGFYSRYFIVPKKDGGLRPILDLRLLNRSVKRLKFKMLTIKQVVSQIRSEDWFVTIDLKDAYFHVSILPHHRKFLRFAFRGEAYQYRVLPFGLALSPRTFTKCVDAALAPLRLQGIRILNYIDDWLILAQSEMEAVRHRDVVLAHMKALGLRLNAKKSVLSPLQRTTYLGVVWDSTTMQARLSPARIESILTAVKRVKEGLSLTVKQFQQLLGLMAAASNVIPFGLLYMRPLQWWLKTKEFSPRGNPLRMIRVTRRCLRALDMWRKPWFLSQGPVLGAPCRRVTLATDASLTGWGAVMSGHPARGLWSGRQLTWHINCLEMLAVFRALKHFLPDLRDRHVLVRTDNTSVVSYINHQGGQTPLAESSLCSWASQLGSRHPVETGAEAREWMLHPEVVKQIWRVFGPAQVDLFATRENTQCPLWYSLVHPAPLGLDAMVQTWPILRLYAFPPIALLPGVLERVRRDGVSLLLVAPYWPGQVWFSDLISLLDGSPWEIPVRGDLLSQAGGTILHPRPELWKLWVWPLTRGLAAERDAASRSHPPASLRALLLSWKLTLVLAHMLLCFLVSDVTRL